MTLAQLQAKAQNRKKKLNKMIPSYLIKLVPQFIQYQFYNYGYIKHTNETLRGNTSCS